MIRKIEKLLTKMHNNPGDIRFTDLLQVCAYYFGKPRQKGTSHCVFKTPWQGDPRINIQCDQHGKAKHYQVKQVLLAIEKWESMK